MRLGCRRWDRLASAPRRRRRRQSRTEASSGQQVSCCYVQSHITAPVAVALPSSLRYWFDVGPSLLTLHCGERVATMHTNAHKRASKLFSNTPLATTFVSVHPSEPAVYPTVSCISFER